MTKLYTTYITALLLAICTVNAFAQKPVLSINATNSYTVNTPIAPLKVTNTGGAVPNLVYSKTTTIAGSGLYGGIDSTALTSSFENPSCVAFDKAGNMYIADANLNHIRK